jgi:hypothetical protein
MPRYETAAYLPRSINLHKVDFSLRELPREDKLVTTAVVPGPRRFI